MPRKPSKSALAKRSNRKVSICIPSGDLVHARFCLSLSQMMMYTAASGESGINSLGVEHVNSSIIPSARYLLVKQALKGGATHLLFLDSDMAFPRDTLLRLMCHDKDVVAVNYLGRRPPYDVVAWIDPTHRVMTTKESTGIVQAWRTGFGIVLIKASVFSNLLPPYFGLPFVPERDDFLGEDNYFFDALQKARIDLFVDQDLSLDVDHIGSCPLNLQAEDLSGAA